MAQQAILNEHSFWWILGTLALLWTLYVIFIKDHSGSGGFLVQQGTI